MDYCYEAQFTLEGVKIDAPLKEKNFSLDPDPSREKAARLYYRFCMPTLSEEEAVEIAKRDVHNFLNFVLLGMYPLGGRSAFSVKFLKIRCTNRKELRQAKQPLPTFMNFNFLTFYKLSGTTLKRAVGELNKYSPVLPDNIRVALNFWRTGLSSEDEYFRFEQVWKAFEIFYRTVIQKNDIEIRSTRKWLAKVLEPSDMKELYNSFSRAPTRFAILDREIKAEGCMSAFDCLVKRNFTSALGSTNYSKDLAQALLKRNPLETLANTVMCLSKLRNNVFHANIFSNKERSIVFVGCSILADILTLSFHRYISPLI